VGADTAVQVATIRGLPVSVFRLSKAGKTY
jgi:hypothetical protein